MSTTNLMTKPLEKKFEKYPLYSQDGKGGDAKVIAKYFNPAGNGTWLITEASKEENGDWTMFGYCHLGDDEMAELGYVMLSDLKALKCPVRIQVGDRILTSYAKVERDLYMPNDITLKEAIKDCGFKVPDWMVTERGIDIEETPANDLEDEVELTWNRGEFDKHIPHEMRPKAVTSFLKDKDENEVYWVTQEPFNEDDLEIFQDALKKYGGNVEKIYVTVRDLSCIYDFEDDKANNVLATVTRDEIIADGYYQALEANGLGDYLKKNEREL